MISWLQRLTAPLDPGAYLEALNPRWSDRLVGTIERITPVSAHAAAIMIRPGRGWVGHRAGQFVTLGVDVEGVRHHRCYSLTSRPGRTDGRIEIGVQHVSGGIVSNHLVHDARPGDVVQLAPAAGDFTLPDRRPARLLLIAGGSGVTPLLGMLRTLAVERDESDVVLLNHAPSADRLMFADELAQLEATVPGLRIDTQLTRVDGRRLDAATLEERCADWRDRETFVCGPESLVDVVTDHWDAAGSMARLHVERFSPTRTAPADPSTTGEGTHLVRFGATALDAVTDSDATLLDVAERAGLTPATGCRMGICHTCVTPLLDGCGRDRRDGRLIEAGAHVQLCVATAASDLTLDL